MNEDKIINQEPSCLPEPMEQQKDSISPIRESFNKNQKLDIEENSV